MSDKGRSGQRGQKRKVARPQSWRSPHAPQTLSSPKRVTRNGKIAKIKTVFMYRSSFIVMSCRAFIFNSFSKLKALRWKQETRHIF